MTGVSFTSASGATYEVVKLLPRMLGTVDMVVAYRRRGRKTTYTAYRHEPNGVWKCLNGAWMSLDVAVEEVAHMHRYALLVSPELIRFLSGAIGLGDEDVEANTPSVRGGPEIGDEAEDLYRKEQGT